MKADEIFTAGKWPQVLNLIEKMELSVIGKSATAVAAAKSSYTSDIQWLWMCFGP